MIFDLQGGTTVPMGAVESHVIKAVINAQADSGAFGIHVWMTDSTGTLTTHSDEPPIIDSAHLSSTDGIPLYSPGGSDWNAIAKFTLNKTGNVTTSMKTPANSVLRELMNGKSRVAIRL